MKLPDRGIILAAFRTEVGLIASSLDAKSEYQELGFLRYVKGSLKDRRLLVGACGMGKVRAAAATQAAIDLFRPGFALFCGTAGAIDGCLKPLDLVVADKLLQHDACLDAPE